MSALSEVTIVIGTNHQRRAPRSADQDQANTVHFVLRPIGLDPLPRR